MRIRFVSLYSRVRVGAWAWAGHGLRSNYHIACEPSRTVRSGSANPKVRVRARVREDGPDRASSLFEPNTPNRAEPRTLIYSPRVFQAVIEI